MKTRQVYIRVDCLQRLQCIIIWNRLLLGNIKCITFKAWTFLLFSSSSSSSPFFFFFLVSGVRGCSVDENLE